MVYLHRGILYNSEDRSFTVTPNHTDESHKHSFEWNEPYTDEHILNYFIYFNKNRQY